MSDAFIVRRGGTGVSAPPEFTYTDGTYTLLDDGKGNWRIKFTSSGTLRFTKFGTGNGVVDLFLVGGGAGGHTGYSEAGAADSSGGGGGGGYTKSYGSISLQLNTDYPIVVGNGGNANSAGGNSSAFGMIVNGGSGHSDTTSGSAGGSAGGAKGENGASNGGSTSLKAGQGFSTREFWELDNDDTADMYAGGGGGAVYTKSGAGGGATGGLAQSLGRVTGGAGLVNTGGGGGGGSGGKYGEGVSSGGVGGSGIVVIRNHRS